jgi:hypothetical protein
MNRENLSEFVDFISNHQLHNKVVGARNNVTFVTDGHILPLIVIVAKLPRKSGNQL